MLKEAGIDFARLRAAGIPQRRFAEALLSSGTRRPTQGSSSIKTSGGSCSTGATTSATCSDSCAQNRCPKPQRSSTSPPGSTSRTSTTSSTSSRTRTSSSRKGSTTSPKRSGYLDGYSVREDRAQAPGRQRQPANAQELLPAEEDSGRPALRGASKRHIRH